MSQDGFDYSDFDVDRLSEAGKFDRRTCATLRAFSRRIEAEFTIPDHNHIHLYEGKWGLETQHISRIEVEKWHEFRGTCARICSRCAHRELVSRLWKIIHARSPVEMRDGKVKPPADQPKVVDISDQIPLAKKGLQDFANFLEHFHENETIRTVIAEANTEGTFARSVAPFHEIDVVDVLRVLERAEEIRGASGQPPNRLLEIRFLEECREFWSEHMVSGARPTPYLDYESEVTDWSTTLYKQMLKIAGLPCDMPGFRTAAKRLSKK